MIHWCFSNLISRGMGIHDQSYFLLAGFLSLLNSRLLLIGFPFVFIFEYLYIFKSHTLVCYLHYKLHRTCLNFIPRVRHSLFNLKANFCSCFTLKFLIVAYWDKPRIFTLLNKNSRHDFYFSRNKLISYSYFEFLN